MPISPSVAAFNDDATVPSSAAASSEIRTCVGRLAGTAVSDAAAFRLFPDDSVRIVRSSFKTVNG